jgi:DNA-binding transcriptional ArsR family regulator
MLNETRALQMTSLEKARPLNKAMATHLTRLAVLLADPLRLKIVGELYMREMSPSQFFSRFGGGSVTRVSRHFQALAEHEWLELIREESGGRRRGGVEHFYRAPEPAILNYEVFLELPYSVRASFSATTFEQFSDQAVEAASAGTFGARPNSYANCTSLAIDRPGSERVLSAGEELFYALFKEQADAKLRAFEAEEELILATVAIGGFESPSSTGIGDGPPAAGLMEFGNGQMPFSWRVSKILADDVCLAIVTELNGRDMSATQFHHEFGGATRSGIHRRFKMLAELDWLGVVDEKSGGKRRGATERFYRATKPALVDASGSWNVPEAVKTMHGWRIFKQFGDRVREALDAGTLDARYDRHLTWCGLLLDQRGWENVNARLERFFALALEESETAKPRLADSNDEALMMTVALMAFESSKQSAKKAP